MLPTVRIKLLGSSVLEIFKVTLPPSKKWTNWHKSDVPWFRKKKNEYQILPKNIIRFLRYKTLAFVYFLGPPLFLWCHLEVVIWNLKNVANDEHNSAYTTTAKIVFYQGFSSKSLDLRWHHIQRGHSNASALLNSKCCNFELKYFWIKAFLDVVSAKTSECEPGIPIWLSQL